MTKEKRLEQIMSLLLSLGSVDINQLSENFDVAKMTIRRDLYELEKRKLIIRTHGGAMLANTDNMFERPFAERLKLNRDKKSAIVKYANTTIHSGDKIFIASGTTMHLLALAIDNSRKLFVVTNSLHIASELVTRSNISIIMIGGELRSNTLSATGTIADNMAAQFQCTSAYMGVNAIDADGNIYLGSTSENGIFHINYEQVENFYILADSTKLGKKDFVNFAKLKRGVTLITDSMADPEMIKNYKDMGAKVVIAG